MLAPHGRVNRGFPDRTSHWPIRHGLNIHWHTLILKPIYKALHFHFLSCKDHQLVTFRRFLSEQWQKSGTMAGIFKRHLSIRIMENMQLIYSIQVSVGVIWLLQHWGPKYRRSTMMADWGILKLHSIYLASWLSELGMTSQKKDFVKRLLPHIVLQHIKFY